jgi:hypothetical protein
MACEVLQQPILNAYQVTFHWVTASVTLASLQSYLSALLITLLTL